MIFLLAFESTHDALAAQKALSEHEPQPHLIPVPKEITAGCGMALRFEVGDDQEAQEIATLTLLPEKSVTLYGYRNQRYQKIIS